MPTTPLNHRSTAPENTESIAAAAARTKLHRDTIRRRIADGTIRAYRFGPKLLRVASDDVDAMLRQVPTAGAA